MFGPSYLDALFLTMLGDFRKLNSWAMRFRDCVIPGEGAVFGVGVSVVV